MDAFTLLHVAGRGTFGTVHAAVRKSEGGSQSAPTHAIKILTSTGSNKKNAESGITEGRLLMDRLHHKNVITIEAIFGSNGDAGGDICLVMPFAAGGSVESALTLADGDRRQLAADAVLHIAEQTAQALAYVHAQGVIHRDVKPANLLLMARPGTVAADGAQTGAPANILEFNVVLSDFGTAKLLQGTRHAGTINLGTEAYSSPEMLANRFRPYGAEVDVWSYGATLFTCATGVLVGGTEEQLSSLVEKEWTLEAAVARLPSTARAGWDALPSNLRGLIARCLWVDPLSRPSAADLVADPALSSARQARDVAELESLRRQLQAAQAELQQLQSMRTEAAASSTELTRLRAAHTKLENDHEQLRAAHAQLETDHARLQGRFEHVSLELTRTKQVARSATYTAVAAKPAPAALLSACVKACKDKDLGLVRELLSRGADVNEINEVRVR